MLPKNKVNQYISLFLLIGLGCLISVGLLSILNSILGSIVLYFLLKPIISFFESKFHLNKIVSISVALLLSFTLILLPLFVISISLADKAGEYIQHPEVIFEQITHLETIISKKLKIDLLSDTNMNIIKEHIASYVSDFLSQTLSIVATMGIMYFLLFFMLLKSTELESNIQRILPYSDKEAQTLKKELEDHIFSNVIVSPLLALMQGISACFLFWYTGLGEPFFWGIVCGVFSLIPFVGSAIIWAPAGFFMISQNNNSMGLTILICGALIISNIDNLFRFVLQKKFADIHPVVTVLGVVIGLYWFGFSGIIFGPLLISIFLILLKNYRKDHILS